MFGFNTFYSRASVSKERKEIDLAENLNKDWKAKMPNRNGNNRTGNHFIEKIEFLF